MNIIIVGLGNVGQELVARLSKEDHSIVAIDTSEKRLNTLVNQYDIKGIIGNGANFDVLKEAEVQLSDLLIACTPLDELNILCCLVARKLGVKDTIARVRTPEYFGLFDSSDFGLSMMVNPEYETAVGISRILQYTSALQLKPFADGKVDLVEFKVTSKTKLDNVELKDIQQHFKKKILVCAVERGDNVVIPTGNFILRENDKIYIITSNTDINSVFEDLSSKEKRIRRVMIIGGNSTAFYLTSELLKFGMKLKIVVNDVAICERLTEAFDKIEIIQGEETDQALLLEEGLDKMDAVVCLGANDEQNIIISMFARHLGVKKVVARVDNAPYYKMLQNVNIDSIVSSKATTADQITRYVRAKQDSQGGSVNMLYRIVDEQAEAIEFTVRKDFRGIGIPLKDLRLKSNILIATIVRNGIIIIPDGNDYMDINDIVVVVTTHYALDDLNEILG